MSKAPHHVVLPDVIARCEPRVAHTLRPWVAVHRFAWKDPEYHLAPMCIAQAHSGPFLPIENRWRCYATAGHTGPHIYWAKPVLVWWPNPTENPFYSVAQED